MRQISKLGMVTGLVAIVLVLAGSAQAVPIPILMQDTDFSNFVVTGPITGMLCGPYNYNNQFTGTICSQVYGLPNGDSLYLYQVDNAGPTVMENLVVFPFYPLLAGGSVTANEPAGFLVGGLTPKGIVYDQAIPEPTVSFNYPSWLGAEVPAGQHTKVLYLISSRPPEIGHADVIDGGVCNVAVYVPTPEPTMLALIGIGAIGILRRRRAR